MGSEFSSLAQRTPIRALRPSSRRNIARLLDRHIPSELNRYNDIRGFMELLGFSNEVIEPIFESETSTTDFIKSWEQLANERGMEEPTIFIGWEILKKLGRTDILSQSQTVVEDAQAYADDRNRQRRRTRSPHDTEENHHFITTDEVRIGQCITYDAFVMYVEKDEDYVKDLYRKAREHNLKLLLPQYHVLPGLPTHDTWAYAISRRCRKLVLVISERFLQSENCEFVVQFSTSLNPAAKSRKVIPILLDDNIRIHLTLGFLRAFRKDEGFDVLMTAIKAPTHTETYQRCYSYPSPFSNIAEVRPTPRPTSDAVSNTELDERLCSMIHRLDFEMVRAQKQIPSPQLPDTRSLPTTLYSRTSMPRIRPLPHDAAVNTHQHAENQNANIQYINNNFGTNGLDTLTSGPVTFTLTDHQDEQAASDTNSYLDSFETFSHGSETSAHDTDSSSYMFLQTRGPSLFDPFLYPSREPDRSENIEREQFNHETLELQPDEDRNNTNQLTARGEEFLHHMRQTVEGDVPSGTLNESDDNSYTFIQARGQSTVDNSIIDRGQTEIVLQTENIRLGFVTPFEQEAYKENQIDNVESQQKVSKETLSNEGETHSIVETTNGVVTPLDQHSGNESSLLQTTGDSKALIVEETAQENDNQPGLEDSRAVYV